MQGFCDIKMIIAWSSYLNTICKYINNADHSYLFQFKPYLPCCISPTCIHTIFLKLVFAKSIQLLILKTHLQWTLTGFYLWYGAWRFHSNHPVGHMARRMGNRVNEVSLSRNTDDYSCYAAKFYKFYGILVFQEVLCTRFLATIMSRLIQ